MSGRALATSVIGALSVGLLLWVAPPAEVIGQISDMNPVWVLVAVALELGSCLSYVVVFRRFFPEPPRAVSRQVAWIAMGAGAVLPGGNISSAAATSWLLRRHGVETLRLIERAAALLCLLTAFGFFVNGAAGVLLLVGVPGGPHDLSHAGIPVLVSVGVLSAAALVVALARRLGARAPRPVRGVAAGLEGAWQAAGTPHWRLFGAAGFLCLDMGALWAACAATGHPLGLSAVVIAYCIGYLATSIPMPAGLGVLDSGLAASLVLYGLSPAASVGAVLVYHAIAIWVPGLGGLIAWLPTRRRRVLARPVVPLPVVPLPVVGPLRLVPKERR
ncbi:MAG: lysylphosphatidylglycerol synthase transmembrane domain-containing protein [Solirubrobacteraceae bacterium]